ncbi:hypothetical protein DIT68_05735 [Brumimicrobium oceani]|uniref:Right handed beta helix domain-containing protein n=1 Tax=Brumimicrobium oceani TaxID=2100725 RepID=A0A2U2XE20_9FLAO|nr:hypothetical protein DIT68_05735 [Brumimicrobium oceani]
MTVTPQGVNNQIIWNSFNENSNLGSIVDNLSSNPDKVIQFSDFEWYERNGSVTYLTLIHIMEVDAGGTPIGNIKQYLLTSNDFGLSWSIMGVGNPNSPDGKKVLKADLSYQFRQSNIEVKKNNPNVLYIVSTQMEHINPTILENTNSYSLHKFDIINSSWSDLSRTGFYTGIGAQPFGFALNPSNEDNWWFYTNDVDKFENGTLTKLTGLYGGGFHPDVRDILIIGDEILAATDGGVYRTTIGANDHIMDISSEGLNMAQSYSLGLAQQPPFYVASGFWHSGLQVYNPDENIWHWGSMTDAKGGEVFFLNNEIFSFENTQSNSRIIKKFNDFTHLYTNQGNNFKGSENLYERSYFIKPAGLTDKLAYNTDDDNFTAITIFNNNTYPSVYSEAEPIVIPNEPDKVAVLFTNQNEDQMLHIYGGLNKTTPEQNLEKDFNLTQIYETIDGTPGLQTNVMNFVFDHRRNGKFWTILKPSPEWGITGKGRIVEYDPVYDEFIDLSYPIDDDPQSNSIFPSWMHINSLEMDRETGVLYLGTGHGVYYIDRENEIWRRYSKDVPMFKSKISIRHCTGELFTSTSYRGIWYADLLRNENTPPLEWKITGIETWVERMNLFCTLVIEPGAKLTIKGELYVFGNQKIVVKPGGKLVVDGGIITSECGSAWGGIEVWGNPQESQLTTNQGYLLIHNGALIENARTAIHVWESGNWNSTGGIVMAYNSTFKNNWRSVEYISYHDFLPSGHERTNRGLFSNCEFLWDDEYEDIFGTDTYTGITMYDVNGVRIHGCDFIDNRTYISNFNNRPTGILSIDASYRVAGKSLTFSPNTTHTEYNETDYDIGKFINLKEGVRASNSNSQATVIIDHIKFLNSRSGVILSAVDNSTVTRNLFEYNSDHPNDISQMNQLSLNEPTSFTVEGNHFINSEIGSAIVGTIQANTGMEQNEIYRNKYEGTYLGNYAIGKNTNDLSGPLLASGLQWLCNDYNNYKFDEFVFSFNSTQGDGHGVRLKQGFANEAAGNKFTNGFDDQQNEFHFSTTDPDNLIYYAFDNPIEIPTELTGNVGVQVINKENVCQSNFNTLITGVSSRFLREPTKQFLESEFAENSEELSLKMIALDSLENVANSSEMYSTVNNLNVDNMMQVRNSLELASPYLSTELLKLVGTRSAPQYPHLWYKDLILMNIEVAQDNTFMEYLLTKNNPLPQNLYDEINDVRNQSITARGEKVNEIIDLDTRKSNIIKLLITNELSDTTAINWSSFNNLVALREDVVSKSQLVDSYFWKEAINSK